MRERIDALDWLRGLMAVAIMFYHLVGWLLFPLDSSSLLGRFGIYGVSIFFVLSGLSMGVVYASFFSEAGRGGIFYIRRIFRIWPMLWVCVFLVVLPAFASGGGVPILKIAANLTTIFGFIKPDFYINTGAWSIGNEMVYYAMTPFLVRLYDASVSYGNLALGVAFFVSIYFSFFAITPELALSAQWSLYINPFNNLFLYVAGVGIYFNLKGVAVSAGSCAAFALMSIAFFVFHPVDGDAVKIVTGWNRIGFMLASILLVISFYRFSYADAVPNAVRFPLEKLGLATYGVYLLHPIIFSYLKAFIARLGYVDVPAIPLLCLVVLLTIIAALLSYRLVEKRFMDIGRRVTSG